MNESINPDPVAEECKLSQKENLKVRHNICGVWVHMTSYEKAANTIFGWARQGLSRGVYAVDPHMVMQTRKSEKYKRIINSADLAIPDGRSIAALMRFSGAIDQQPVCGPDLMPYLCGEAEKTGVKVGFFGGEPQVLNDLVERISLRYPELDVAYACSPPFRKLTDEEDEQIIIDCHKSGIQILFVALGCPKQECWIADHLGKLNTVMVGVGWAFSIHSGWSRRAPDWMQRLGIEGLFQMILHPRRYLLRYLKYLPGYCVHATISAVRAHLR